MKVERKVEGKVEVKGKAKSEDEGKGNINKTLGEGISHYVNACGNNWDTLFTLFLMAFRNTPHGTSKFTPFYMLHGREMVLPSLQVLKVKLGPEIRNSEHAPRLKNLKANMKSAYKLAREHARRAHGTSKRCYDRGARDRNFPVRGYVYLYSPAVKRGLSSKFRKPWSGPWLITAQKRSHHSCKPHEGGPQPSNLAKKIDHDEKGATAAPATAKAAGGR
jgi:hypothetical protein